MNVLVVVDNPRVRDAIRAAIGDPDHDITQARTPARAIALLEEGRAFDVIVADADLVPAGGFVLARDVKARRIMGLSSPPVVLLLSRSQDAFLSDWSQADAYVNKPTDAFDLAQTIRAVSLGEPVPALPGVGGSPKPSLLDRPAEEVPAELSTGVLLAASSEEGQAARADR